MSFSDLKNNLDDLERILDCLKENAGRNRATPVDLDISLDKEKILLTEIENLKNQLLERSKDPQKKENQILEIEEKQIQEIKDNHIQKTEDNHIQEIKDNHRKEIDRIKAQYESEIRKLESKIEDLTNKSKSLKKEIMDLKGSIRVLCRIRPLQDSSPCDLLITDTSIRIKKDRLDNSFEFDRVFDASADQAGVFEEIEETVESIFDGYKACLFAYGQTGSGKTYTMIGSQENKGILGRSLEKIRSNYREFVEGGWTVKLRVSCFEIYNEEIKDLLGEQQREKVNIIHAEGTTSLQNCTELEVGIEDLEGIVSQGLIKRRVGSTMSNTQSSRSHTIFVLKTDLKREGEVRGGVLCLIDLAGSERLDKSKAEGKRLKETQNINRSLSCLGDVFMAILNKDSYIPFRNSKLTYFLQEYLTGRSRVSMILNISQEDLHYYETVCTLRFGFKVSECKLGKVSRSIFKRG